MKENKPLTLQEAFDIFLERIDYRGDYRDAKFAPERTLLSKHDILGVALPMLYLAVPKTFVTRPEEDRPNGKTWYFRVANPEEYDEEDLEFFTEENLRESLDKVLGKMANKDPKALDNNNEEDEDQIQEID